MGSDADSPRSDRSPRKHRGVARVVFGILALLRGLVYLLGLAWAFGAIYYDGPVTRDGGNTLLAIGYVIAALLFLAGLTKPLRRFIGWVLAMGIVLVPWLMIEPSGDGAWQPQWSKTGWAKIDGDLITFKNFRNFDYGPDGKVTVRWEDRSVHLSKLRGLDYFHHEIGGDLLAHPVLSFDFGDDGHIAFSIESRRRVGEKYSPVKGLYKQYGLIYSVGDERDFIRERTTVRDQPARLYRTSYNEVRIREMFFETITTLNDLNNKPRFYHSIFANCTTCYLAQAPAGKRGKLDYRLLLNGRIESLYYERGIIATGGLPLKELKERATINEAARASRDDPEFSTRIREGRPGF